MYHEKLGCTTKKYDWKPNFQPTIFSDYSNTKMLVVTCRYKVIIINIIVEFTKKKKKESFLEHDIYKNHFTYNCI